MIGARSEAAVEASCESSASVVATPHSLQSCVCNSGSPSAWAIALANRIGLPQLGQAGVGVMRSSSIGGRMTVRRIQTVMKITFSAADPEGGRGTCKGHDVFLCDFRTHRDNLHGDLAHAAA
jgi:hypothetical protein